MNTDALSRRPFNDQENAGNDSAQSVSNESAEQSVGALSPEVPQSNETEHSLQSKEYIQVELTYGSIP